MGYKEATVPRTATLNANGSSSASDEGLSFPIENVPVANIRPEQGLARKRDREGHRELQRSIERFGVLTPITVRRAPDNSGDYLLIKGQGRTLACLLLGIETIPAVVVGAHFAEDEKVQQFLVENVARLKMRPVDRALLVHRARQAGEETTDIARRFGLTAASVRRLLAQLNGATQSEVAALRSGDVNLANHAVIARYVGVAERADVVALVASSSIRSRDLEGVFVAIGWQRLSSLGVGQRDQRLALLSWVFQVFAKNPSRSLTERIRLVARLLPLNLEMTAPDLRAMPR